MIDFLTVTASMRMSTSGRTAGGKSAAQNSDISFSTIPGYPNNNVSGIS
jgi:hypothetical protein